MMKSVECVMMIVVNGNKGGNRMSDKCDMTKGVTCRAISITALSGVDPVFRIIDDKQKLAGFSIKGNIMKYCPFCGGKLSNVYEYEEGEIE